MRALYQNVIFDNSSISATDENGNRPVENLYHRYLELAFEALATTSTVTIEWDEDQIIDSLGIGFFNITSMDVTFRNSSDTILFNGSYSPTGRSDMIYFTEMTTVRKAVIIFTAAENICVGALSLGEFLQFPKIDINPTLGLEDRSDYEKSPGGQINGEDAVVLEVVEWSASNMDQFYYDSIQTMVKTNKRKTPLFLDRYEDHRTLKEPLYCNIVDLSGGARRTPRDRFDLSGTFEECN